MKFFPSLVTSLPALIVRVKGKTGHEANIFYGRSKILIRIDISKWTGGPFTSACALWVIQWNLA